MQDRVETDAVGIEVAVTSDGGRGWTRAGPSRSSVCAGGAGDVVRDQSIDIGPDGTVYLASVAGGTGQQEPATVQVSTSADTGGTWTAPVSVAGGLPRAVENGDFPRVVADPNAGGRAWVSWYTLRPGPVPVATTDLAMTEDGGKTWARVSAPPVPPGTLFAPPQLHVRPDGSLLAVLVSVPAAPLAAGIASVVAAEIGVATPEDAAAPIDAPVDAAVVVSQSLDRGRSWSPPVEVAPLALPHVRVEDAETGRPIEYLRASSAVDPTNGHLHVVWQGKPSADGWVMALGPLSLRPSSVPQAAHRSIAAVAAGT